MFLTKVYGNGNVVKAIKKRIPLFPGLPINYDKQTTQGTMFFYLHSGIGKEWYGFIPNDVMNEIESLNLKEYIKEETVDTMNFIDKATEEIFIENQRNRISKEHFKKFQENGKIFSLTANLFQWMKWAYPDDFNNIYNDNKHLIDKDFNPLVSKISVNHLMAEYLSGYEPAYNANTRRCLHCGKVFPVLRKDKQYCSNKCRVYYMRNKKGLAV